VADRIRAAGRGDHVGIPVGGRPPAQESFYPGLAASSGWPATCRTSVATAAVLSARAALYVGP
jgi:hypothetical protein